MRLRERHIALSSRVSTLIEERDRALSEMDSFKRRLSIFTEYEVLVSEAANLLKDVAEKCEKSSKDLIERIIDHGLKVIFDERESFTIRTETKSRSVYAYMCLGESSAIMDSRGGGVVDVVSVLTVLTLVLQQKKNMRRFLVLDESFAEVGVAHLDKVGSFLRFLADKLGMTILIVTHSKELLGYATVAYDVWLDSNGYTKLKRRELEDMKET